MIIKIEEYCDEYLEGVNSVLEEAFSHRKNNFNDANFKEIVALCDNTVCGYLLLTKVLNPIKNKYYYLVDYVCVSSEYRGNGIALKMLEYAENVAKKDGAIYLQLTCSYSREAAQKLYEKAGYEKRESNVFRKELS
ncbi:MAG: GNAT family N-acetyltransferase [Bacilli bacterium]|nr:GNAT family N-acetyltransferase [Bacilli bacterium]